MGLALWIILGWFVGLLANWIMGVKGRGSLIMNWLLGIGRRGAGRFPGFGFRAGQPVEPESTRTADCGGWIGRGAGCISRRQGFSENNQSTKYLKGESSC